MLFWFCGALFVTFLALQAANFLYTYFPTYLLYSFVHFLGGTSVGFFSLWLGQLLGTRVTILHCICLVLLIGGAWEVWEFMLGLISFPADTIDSVSDLMLDAAGTLLVYYMVQSVYART